MAQGGAQAAEGAKAGAGKIGDAGAARPFAAGDDDSVGFEPQRRQNMLDERAALVQALRLVAAELP